MSRFRCSICRYHVPTIKNLKSHYMHKHSKIQIIRQIIKCLLPQTTQAVFVKPKKPIPQNKCNTIYLQENVQITCTNNTIVIEDGSCNDNLIELTFDSQDYTIYEGCEETGDKNNLKLVSLPSKRKTKKSKKSRKLYHIGIRKLTEPSRSLHECTGEFYECHCMEKESPKASSDTESCSDAGKTLYCNTCGNGYQTTIELANHEKLHQFHCKLCSHLVNAQNYREHVEQHILRVFVCHLCGMEFICKEILMAHLGHHFEQQTFEHVLDMEQEYNMYDFCNTNFSTGDYRSNINNILFFLTYPYDHNYSRNMFMKVVCDICFQEFHIYDYERHLKLAHFFR